MRIRNIILIVAAFAYGIISGCGQSNEEAQEETKIVIGSETNDFEKLMNEKPVSDKPIAEAVDLTKEPKHVAICTKAEVIKTEATTKAATEAPPKEPAPSRSYYGVMELTAYEWTGNPCADGVYPVEWWTVASNDPALWHRRIFIEGYGDFYVHDRGGMASNVLDIYLGDVWTCYQFGRQTARIYVYD